MNTPLDNAISATAAAEATYEASTGNVDSIQTAIDAATAPLAPAKAKLASNAQSFNEALDALSAAAQASKVAVPSAS